MRYDDAILYLPLVEAMTFGRIIQANRKLEDGSDNWVDLEDEVKFTCSPERYRVKPEEFPYV